MSILCEGYVFEQDPHYRILQASLRSFRTGNGDRAAVEVDRSGEKAGKANFNDVV